MKIFSKKFWKIVYVVIFMLALILPGVWTFVGSQKIIGNEEEVDFSDVGYLNVSDKVDRYMNQKFGFRNKLVNLYNGIKYQVFSEGGNNQVIVGKDDWLFFASALSDYNGQDLLTDAEIDKIARILSMVQKNVEDKGGKFLFVSAPNKMEIYGEYMPYYHIEYSGDGNYEKLFLRLDDIGVNNVDLKELLKSEKVNRDYLIYYKTDSHWNDLGAAIAYENIMKYLNKDYIELSDSYEIIYNAYKSDLDKMIFPDKEPSEDIVKFEHEFNFYYTSNYRGANDLVIQTANDDKTDNLIMWRDSFGEALYYMFAENFNTAEFRREIPYNMSAVKENDVVIIELVERNLSYLLWQLPIIVAQETEIEADENVNVKPEILVENKNGFKLISAKVENIPSDCLNVYFRVDTEGEEKIFEAYPSAADGDTCIYLEEISEKAEISIIYEFEGKIYETLKNSINCV